MKKSLLLFMLFLLPIMALAQYIPVAILSTEDNGAKTLTFTYAESYKATASNCEDGIYKLNEGKEAPGWINPLSYDQDSITKVVFVEKFKYSRPTSTSYWFFNLRYLTTIEGLDNLNTSKVTNMSNMFSGCMSLTKLDVSKFDTYYVTNMSDMFNECRGLTNLDVNNFNTGNVTNMSNMFYNCRGLTNLDVSNFNTGNVTNMSNMFSGCMELTNLDVRNFNTNHVIDMSFMFASCSKLTNIDLSNFNTDNTEDMVGMFINCSSLTKLDLKSFKTDYVRDMQMMFGGCTKLTSINLSSFKTDEVSNMALMFCGCSGLTSLDVSMFNTSNVEDMSEMFYGCTGLTSLDVSMFNTEKVKNMNGMFYGCSQLSNIDVSYFNTKEVKDMGYMFFNCTGLSSLDIHNLEGNYDNLSPVNIEKMLYGCKNIKSLIVGNNSFFPGDVINDHDAFYGIGTPDDPCILSIGNGFDKGVLGYKYHNDKNNIYYYWKGGYFSLLDTSGIAEKSIDDDNIKSPVYNLGGQLINENSKGLIIQRGKKYIRK